MRFFGLNFSRKLCCYNLAFCTIVPESKKFNQPSKQTYFYVKYYWKINMGKLKITIITDPIYNTTLKKANCKKVVMNTSEIKKRCLGSLFLVLWIVPLSNSPKQLYWELQLRKVRRRSKLFKQQVSSALESHLQYICYSISSFIIQCISCNQ